MNKYLISSSALIMCLTTTAVYARHDRNDSDYYDKARVVNVEPITRMVHVTVPQRECYQEEVRTPVYEGGRSSSAGGAVVGGVVGGILGHKLSKGKGAATVAGTLLGAAVGNEVGKANAAPPSYHEEIAYVDRCEVRQISRTEERIDGYRVTYEYKGETFTTHMPYDPGKHLRVRISVAPVVE
jgi:uncharacterized protein YcfJ